MHEPIELAISSPDGIIDCRLEPEQDTGVQRYEATILYPAIVNGYSRSEIYCYKLVFDPNTRTYVFDRNEDILPKVGKLEHQLSDAIQKSNAER